MIVIWFVECDENILNLLHSLHRITAGAALLLHQQAGKEITNISLGSTIDIAMSHRWFLIAIKFILDGESTLLPGVSSVVKMGFDYSSSHWILQSHELFFSCSGLLCPFGLSFYSRCLCSAYNTLVASTKKSSQPLGLTEP
ncbi:hypothetical protein K7X08_006167 [Anisodus acutangulus]|uniref:Uncharacterized protein n=1 Tax=Anisodus acutangulus TaxID=402998 RepID=A0A9Q1MVK7_9SOLA|nr:hypothetical protein K7X08_006167 [Anisodus acutangulus]